MNEERPDPDRLLAEIKREEIAAQRGKLKIFIGACAGVGKTYAMLNAAQQRIAEGIDVVIGVVETHGRSETIKLLEKFPEVLPLRKINYRGKSLAELDIDTALQRAPQLIIVDELAHTNIEGSRHVKRWQDVDELLVNGINVYTTLNVQHLESLNDVVGGITGIRIWETIPDRFFDSADEVTLVDLPPDELLERLKEGKVYIPEQVEHAAKNFFRKGNLIALRELALRRTADRVDLQMRAYRADHAIANVWQARERIIACIGPGSIGDKLVRSAARLANELKADWLAVYVETPALQRLSKTDRQRILDHLKLAEELGAETATLAGSDLIATLIAYSKSRNANKLVVGHPTDLPWYQQWHPRFIDTLARFSPDIDIYVVGNDKPSQIRSRVINMGTMKWWNYAWATAACGVTTILAAGLLRIFDLSNVVMLLLLTVVGVSIRFGRGAGAWAAALSVLLFDFFFVPPRFSFVVSDVQYFFTFTLMLLIALIIGQLAAKLQFEATTANIRERRAQALAALSKELSGALTVEQVVEIANRHVSGTFNSSVAVFLPSSQEKIKVAGTSSSQPIVDTAVAQWVYDHQLPAGFGTQTLSAAVSHYLPLQAPMRTRGVLVLEAKNLLFLDEPEEKRLLDTFAAQIALALERVHYVEVAQDALVLMEGERLRNSLLSAISHDLRTPLTALVGLASTLTDSNLPENSQKELAIAIQNEAQQMSDLVTNLLDMARLQTGGVKLKKDWQSIEEIVGSACMQLHRVLATHKLVISIPPNLPLCECDPILIQRVIVNLLSNAAKFTSAGSIITISAAAENNEMAIVIEDNGPGLPRGQETRLFDKFTRGETESNKPGVGLGLALCKAIIEAHDGKIFAENCIDSGARFTIKLPLGIAPMPEELL
ncbi:sensor histidine kinase [Nitrosomonas oligotropha]|uniref:histidine kinase n=1 Tax=Nitrosomonas oligotropha TaxID=42354 RepID=A0A1H8TJJ4_9PROT|nr:sensor histidine kinase KdpD [Nitrosomonas oligotropha]SDX32126.1 two-component system, OmpR family, sensor histidine kinase KdpD [Nitrosomonas oligotropha]SEO91249.1 two-component system, OmpR family, sensor histidine kinase KdpD [Nitrosomonas oligotropha]